MSEEKSKSLGEQLEDGVQVLVQAIEKRRHNGMTNLSEVTQIAQVSTAISAKRQADALESIAMAVHDIYMILRERG